MALLKLVLTLDAEPRQRLFIAEKLLPMNLNNRKDMGLRDLRVMLSELSILVRWTSKYKWRTRLTGLRQIN